MAGKEEAFKDGANALTDYVYVSSLGIPVCNKPGLSRHIQSTHKSHIYCSRGDGRYTLCKHPPSDWQEPELRREKGRLPDCLIISKPAGINEIAGFSLPFSCKVERAKESASGSRFNEPLQQPKFRAAKHQVLQRTDEKQKFSWPEEVRSNRSNYSFANENEAHFRYDHDLSLRTVKEEKNSRVDVEEQKKSDSEETRENNNDENGTEEKELWDEESKLYKDELEEAIKMEKLVREAITCDDKLPEYEDLLDAEGWRAQLPYDPYNLKPIKFRLPYYKKLPPQPAHEEYSNIHYKFNSPFFLNTIPALKYSFIIHPNFISESLEERMRQRRQPEV